MREHQPGADLTSIVGWLSNRLDWAFGNHPAIDEFARELKEMTKALKAIAREHDKGESAGRCPAKLRDETRCNTRLTVDPYINTITCRRCGTSWDRRRQGWVMLKSAQTEWEEAA
jgi:hypothetical protein